jgi:hypothetical protein
VAVRFIGVGFITASTLALLAACGSAPPPKPPTPVEEVPEPQNSEWLYATKGVHSAELSHECEHVRSAIKEEEKCNGEACAYASRLTEDWLRRCKKAAPPAAFEEVTALGRQYDERKQGARVPCMRDIEKILTSGCMNEPNCGDIAQEWTTRCSDEAGSPLIVRILETRVSQAGARSGDTKLDKRGCKELAGDILNAANCAQKFQCEDALTAVGTFRSRCLSGGALPGVHEGLAELSIRIGAEQKTEPLPILADSPAIDPKRFAVPLADNTGIVGLVCGERATDVDAYLALRKDCADGEIVIFQRQRARSKSSLRTGRFPHKSDGAFASTYPSLMVRGEVAARTSAGLTRLATALAALGARASAEAKYDPELGSALIAALGAEATAFRAAQERSALAASDEALVPLFRSLARAKVEAAKAIFKPLENAAFVRRALRRPLADLDSEGRISSSALNLAAILDLDAALPKAMAAYKAELSVFAERVAKKSLSDKNQATLSDELVRARSSCAAAQGKALESEGALLECGFDVCDPELLKEVSGELTNARIDGTVAYLKVVLAAESFDSVPAVPDKAPRCVEPWW